VIRVLVVDDHPMVRAGLEAMLRAEPGLVPVGGAAHALGLWRALRGTRADVVVLDHHLPGEDGLVVCRALRREPAAPAVVMYTMAATETLRDAARASGAAAVVDKAADPDELFDAIRLAGRRHPAAATGR